MATRQPLARAGSLFLLAACLTAGVAIAVEGAAAKDRAIEATLRKPLRLHFKDVPLREVLAHVEKATSNQGGPGIAISPVPRAEGTVAATRVTVETEDGEPLGDALSYLLGAHKLGYRVRDGRLWIEPRMGYLIDRRKSQKALLARLEKRIDLKLGKTSLDKALSAIQAASQGPEAKPISLYIDPVGLQEADVAQTTPVSLEARGVPIKTVLHDLLEPLGLTYAVKDGLVTVTCDDPPLAPARR